MKPIAGTYTAISSAQGQGANSNTTISQAGPLQSEATLRDANGALWRANFSEQLLANSPVAPGRVFTWDGTDVPELVAIERVPVAQP